jgi:ferredoxin
MGAPRWKISVNRRICMSSGLCEAVAGQWFEVTGDGTRPLADELDPSDGVIEAAEACPVSAITVLNAADGTVVAP